MKTLKKITLTALAALMLIFTSCKREEEFAGRLRVNMTDAPGDYQEVNVDVRAVQIFWDDPADDMEGRWLSLDTRTGIYNLIELQGGVTTVLAEEDYLPVGRVEQLRLVLGEENNVLLTNGQRFPLTVPSGSTSGLKVNVHMDIEAEKDYELLLDFDADKSVHVTGEGSYMLKPVLKLIQ